VARRFYRASTAMHTVNTVTEAILIKKNAAISLKISFA
jgi:hypothetical protein